MAVIVIPEDYKYVLLAATGAALVNFWHGIEVGYARKRAGVPYPNAYASTEAAAADVSKYVFNCAQRAHQNYLEQLPTTLTLLAVAGLKYPVYAAGTAFVHLIGRVLYTKGYINPKKKDGTGRYLGAPLYIPTQLALLGMAGKALYDWIV